jgi:hypothetical protein
VTDARETADSFDAWYAGSDRDVRETADSWDVWTSQSDREVRETGDSWDVWYALGNPALESRVTQFGVIVWSEPPAPPTVATFTGQPEVQGATAHAYRVQGATPIVVVQGASAGASRVTGSNAS